MNKPIIGLIAAMPEETAQFLKLNRPFTRSQLNNRPFFTIEKESCTIHLVEAGMGKVNAKTACNAMLSFNRPALLMSIGLCGAVSSEPQVGDLIIAGSIFEYSEGTIQPQPALDQELINSMASRLTVISNVNTHIGTFITTDASINKKSMRHILPRDLPYPALEMESSAIARAAADAGVRFAAVRTVSDDSREELGFAITDFTDKDLRIRPAKVLYTLCRRPWLFPQLVRLAINSRIAGANLAAAIHVITEGYHA